MIKSPRPTVMLSSLTQEGVDVTFDALRYGAVDFIPKPVSGRDQDIETQKKEIIEKVKLASGVDIESFRFIRSTFKGSTPLLTFCEECGVKNFIVSQEMENGNGWFKCQGCGEVIAFSKYKSESKNHNQCEFVLAVGAAEGGYNVLLKIIPKLLPRLPMALIVVIYDTPQNVASFARYLDDISSVIVKTAKDGEPIETGVCYLSSGYKYVSVNYTRGRPRMHVNDAPFPSNRGSVNM
jgi:two-component system chemotaxis response regulator CheB